MAVREQRPAFPHLNLLMERELERFRAEHPRSLELAERAKASLLDGVPMHWMVRWAGGFPIFAQEAHGSRFTDVDGIEYVDFCLGDTGAMTGHSPEPVVKAISEQAAAGSRSCFRARTRSGSGTSCSAASVCRFWQFALTATDANRFAIRIARAVTGRPKILVFNWCYHGTVDETVVTLDDGDGPATRGERRTAGRSRRDDARRRVQRPRWARARARARRRRLRARGACADEHRNRPARAGLPRRAARADPPLRDAPRHRRDPHDCAGPGGYTRGTRPRPRPADDREADRERDPRRRLRAHRGCRRTLQEGIPEELSDAAGSAARSPPTCSRSPRCGRRWPRS